MSNTDDRAEFEAWARQCCYDIERAGGGIQYQRSTTEQVWLAWQAARRAPAVPVPQGLREAAQAVVERWDTPLWKDVPATAVYIADLRAALAAAPQPPEAESMISSREVVSNPGSGVKVTRLNLSEAGRAALQSKASHIPDGGYSVSNAALAAPVQMPEPVAYMLLDKDEPEAGFIFAKDSSAEWHGSEPLYTDQQVRQLLAAHGIKEQST